MKTAFILLVCVAAVLAQSETEYTKEEGVYVLTDKNFGDALNEFDYALVEFYAPWCGHCKTLAPEYAKAAQELAHSNPNVKLCKVDATEQKEVAGKYEVRGFPTLKFFIKGNPSPIAYEAGRSAGDIVNWLKKKTGPPSVHIKSVEEAEKIISDHQAVAFYFGSASSEGYANFLSVAQTFDDLIFAHSHDDDVNGHYKVSGQSLILFKKFDEKKNTFEGVYNDHEIREFLNAHRFPTVLPFDQKTAQRIFGENKPAIILIRGNDEAGQNAEDALTEAAPSIKDKILISLSKIDEGLGQRLADYIGIKRETLPAFRIIDGQNKYPLDQEITVESIKSFVQSFKDGTLTAYFKSEPIPSDPYDEHVRVVVGKNFEEIVLDPESDVLIEFYAPWCGHCKSLAPIYSSVAQRLKNVEGLVIAKMDATANEAKGVQVTGFPSIKFYPKGNKHSPVDFDSQRTESGFYDYLRKFSSARIPSFETDL